MQAITEEKEVRRLNDRADRKADDYFKRYRKQIEELESGSVLQKVKGTISNYDICALGQQLESWDDYLAICEETGTVSNLGTIPSIAHDVITVAYGTSPISTIASVQPIEEEHGMVYFKEIRTAAVRGDIAADSIIARSDGAPSAFPGADNDPFAGDRAVVGTVTTEGTGPHAITAAAAFRPLRPYKTEVIATVRAGTPSTLKFRDLDGDGKLLNAEGGVGTVDYETGAISITLPASHPLVTDSVSNDNLVYWASTDFESQDTIPTIVMKLTSKAVRARVFALRNTIGLPQAYAMKKRFGMMAEDDLATDLVAEINTEILRSLIYILNDKAVGTTNWSRTPGFRNFFSRAQANF